jgi:hypothetical protein
MPRKTKLALPRGRAAKKPRRAPRKPKPKRKRSSNMPYKPKMQILASPRPRVRMRTALRAAGLDEWKVSIVLNGKVDELARPKKSKRKDAEGSAARNKLLLDYLKEATRHLDPPSARAVAEAEAATEILHDIPRASRAEPVQ